MNDETDNVGPRGPNSFLRELDDEELIIRFYRANPATGTYRAAADELRARGYDSGELIERLFKLAKKLRRVNRGS